MMSWWIGIGVEAPGRRPVRRDEAGLGQLATGRLRVVGQPGAHGSTRRGSSSGGSSKSIRRGPTAAPLPNLQVIGPAVGISAVGGAP